jgi:predicted nuclease of predicted toxin-antitoxin system
MLRVLADENFNHHILRGLKRRYFDLDCIIVQETDLLGAPDSALLEWAAQNDRVLLTHDFKTMLRFAHARIRAGKPMSGVIAIPSSLSIREGIDALAMVIECCRQADFKDSVVYLPL